MIPSPRLLMLLACWLASAVVASLYPELAPIWKGFGVAIVLLAGADATLRQIKPTFLREVDGSMSLGVWSEVKLHFHNQSRSRLQLEVFDCYPPQVATRGMPARVSIGPREWAKIRYEMRPIKRGELCFSPAQARIRSHLGLWWRTVALGDIQCIKVYPNFAAIANYALLAIDNRLSALGVRLRQRRGEGTEFNQLREYRGGDSLRQVDWKATSRLEKLISREYQDERDQQIVFLIDCGRRMRAKDGDLGHFDHALNAVLLLSYVALRQGDAVGLMGFAGDDRFLQPAKGTHHINRILETVYDMQTGMQSPDYAGATADLLKRLNKRSLVIMVTNLRDEDNEELLPLLGLLRRKNLVLLASLREGILRDTLDRPIERFEDALTHSASLIYLAERRKSHEAIQASGAQFMDVEPEALPLALVNRYLEIKRSGSL